MTIREKTLDLSPKTDFRETIVARLECWLAKDDISRIPRELVEVATMMLKKDCDWERKGYGG